MYRCLLALVALTSGVLLVNADCSTLCCQGKNNTCRLDIDGRKGDKCFCDSACLEIGDCCPDYRLNCPPIDCVVDDAWSEWSECDVRCGPGVRQRVRRVRQEATNGGRCTERLVEKAVCEGTGCKFVRTPQGYEEMKEIGKIIPASYGPWRKDKLYNPYKDIRRNLYEHYSKNDSRQPYCMQFELTHVRSSTCSQLTVGQTVCVECQPLAMKRELGARCRGHGVVGKQTRWSLVRKGACRGKWVLKSRRYDCQCPVDSPLSYILV